MPHITLWHNYLWYLLIISYNKYNLRQFSIKVLYTFTTKNFKIKNKITLVKVQKVMHTFKFATAHLILATAHNFRPC